MNPRLNNNIRQSMLWLAVILQLNLSFAFHGLQRPTGRNELPERTEIYPLARTELALLATTATATAIDDSGNNDADNESASTAGSSRSRSSSSSSSVAAVDWKNRIRYRCRVAYDGSGMDGFQLQAGKQEKRTVQGEIEKVLSTRFNRPVRVVGAGRTDAGVHARGQAVHFDLTKSECDTSQMMESIPFETVSSFSTSSFSSSSLDELPSLPNLEKLQKDWDHKLERSMNRMLPTDVQVYNVQAAPSPKLEWIEVTDPIEDEEEDEEGGGGDDLSNKRQIKTAWNVMRKSTGKLYSYRFCAADWMDPIERHSRWQLDWGYKVDIDYLKTTILPYLEGTHDFVCFAGRLEQTAKQNHAKKLAKFEEWAQSNSTEPAKREGAKPPPMKKLGTIRTIKKINLIEEDKERQLYRIDIYLDGALYKMVRNIVGTALDVSRGALSESDFLQLLNPKQDEENEMSRKSNKCKPAPPQGLTLERVFYVDEFDKDDGAF